MSSIKSFITQLKDKNKYEPEFLQAVTEIAEDIIPYMKEHHPEWIESKILERMVEPERIISFRVTWVDDKNQIQINKGYRVQMNSAIGPYKGGLRFAPDVNLSTLKFLATEQILKNSLTGQSIGAGKGGSDFNPKEKSDGEIMRFCQSFMTELHRHIGADIDVPAGDIGVGSREIGYMYGQFKRLQNNFTSSLTGKGLHWGGSEIRTEATGYGVLYFLQNMLKQQGEDVRNKKICISGAGNVAFYAAEKAIEMGGKVLTISNSTGTLHDKDGLTAEKLQYVKTLGRDLESYTKKYRSSEFFTDTKPWNIPCDIALPCATQNEITEEDAKTLIKNGCRYVAEGANMPSTNEAIKLYHEAEILFAPGKASNAGGVAISALEMSQNDQRVQWSRDSVDNQLKLIMARIHQTCVTYGKSKDDAEKINYLKGANIGGFIRVAQAMTEQGII